MITDEPNRRTRYEAHLKSDLWQKQRRQAFERWGRFCTVCGKPDAVHVHHLNYRNLTDCIPEDFMPLCERCHGIVHNTPELDNMARTLGEPMEKRRMVLLRLKEVKTVTTVVKTITIRERPVKLSKKQRRQAQRMANELIRKEARERAAAHRESREGQSFQTGDRRAEKHAQHIRYDDKVTDFTLKILCARFKVGPEVFAGWPDSTVNRILKGDAFPIFARPALAREIAATPADATITLTKQDVEALRTDKNAFTRFTIDALGMDWGKLEAGWVSRLIGSTMPRAQYLRALAGKTIYSKASRSIAL